MRGALDDTLVHFITKHHWMGGLTTEIYFLTVLEARSPRSRWQWDSVPSLFGLQINCWLSSLCASSVSGCCDLDYVPFSTLMGFPGGASGKESTCQRKRRRRHGFYPWIGKIPWRRAWQPTPVLLPGEFSLDQGAWWATVHGVANESQRTEWLSTTYIVEGPNASVTIIEEMRPLRIKF